jgi:hypothetical protein
MRLARHVEHVGKMTNACKILVGEPEGKRPFLRPRRRREDSIRMVLRKIWWKSVEWMHLPQNRGQWRVLVNTVKNLQVP